MVIVITNFLFLCCDCWLLLIVCTYMSVKTDTCAYLITISKHMTFSAISLLNSSYTTKAHNIDTIRKWGSTSTLSSFNQVFIQMNRVNTCKLHIIHQLVTSEGKRLHSFDGTTSDTAFRDDMIALYGTAKMHVYYVYCAHEKKKTDLTYCNHM